MKKCPKCGEVNPERFRVCEKCGESLSASGNKTAYKTPQQVAFDESLTDHEKVLQAKLNRIEDYAAHISTNVQTIKSGVVFFVVLTVINLIFALIMGSRIGNLLK